MSYTQIQVTGLSITALDGTPINGCIIFTPSIPDVIPGTSVLQGSAIMTVVNGVGTPINIPTTDAITPNFTYTITQRLNTADGVNPAPVTNVIVPSSLGASVDVSAVI